MKFVKNRTQNKIDSNNLKTLLNDILDEERENLGLFNKDKDDFYEDPSVDNHKAPTKEKVKETLEGIHNLINRGFTVSEATGISFVTDFIYKKIEEYQNTQSLSSEFKGLTEFLLEQQKLFIKKSKDTSVTLRRVLLEFVSATIREGNAPDFIQKLYDQASLATEKLSQRADLKLRDVDEIDDLFDNNEV